MGRSPKVLHEGPIYPYVDRAFRHRTFAALQLGLLGLMACAAIAQTADNSTNATFRTNVTEVRMTFAATDQNNHVISTVQPNDFAIVDGDMVVRDFRSFTRSEYTRLEVTVLVDTSGSMTSQFRRELADVVQIITQTEGVPEESFTVVSFHDLKPTVVCDGNCRALNADGQFPLVKDGGLTPLYDSLVFASRKLGRGGSSADPHVRKLLLLFSDGSDTISLASFADALNSALENEVAIYTVDLNQGSNQHASNASGTRVLRALAANTGGRYFSSGVGISKVVDAILEDFHSTYAVAYKLPYRAAGFHQVRILPTHDLSLQFRCRRGYYYSSDQEN